jgi:hypothetical protein
MADDITVNRNLLMQTYQLCCAMERQLMENNIRKCTLKCNYNTNDRPQIVHDNTNLSEMWEALSEELENILGV